MKIYTKTGDDGTTGLLGGERVLKCDVKIEAYGTIDELNAHIGSICDLYNHESIKNQLLSIQNHLFIIGSHLATTEKGTKMNLPNIEERDIQTLESWMDNMEESLPPLQHFILPGGHSASSAAQIARCICRRAERRMVEIGDRNENAILHLKYINRLSDYLFMLSRFILQEFGIEAIKWEPIR